MDVDQISNKGLYLGLKKTITDLEKHKDLLDQLSNIVFFAFAKTGRITYSNHAAKSLLTNYWTDATVHDIFPGITDLSKELEHGEEVVFSEILFLSNVPTPYEIRIRKKRYESSLMYFIIGQDITEKLSFEHEILKAKNDFEAILNSTYDAIFIHNVDGQILDVNDSAVAIYDLCDKDSAFQYTIEDCSAEDNDFSVLQSSWEEVLDGKQMLMEWKAKSPVTGREFDVEVAMRSTESLRQKAVVAVVRDISERKQIENILRENERKLKLQNDVYSVLNEELKERNGHIQKINKQLEQAKQMAEESDRLKSAFLANMSHEIRTPLNAIIGFSQLMAENPSDPETLGRYSQIIKQRGNDLIRIISDILDISKIEAGHIEIFNEEVELGNFFKELEEGYSENPFYRAKFNVVDLVFSIDEGLLSKTISIDSSRLNQILINLIDNALKFTEQGTVGVSVKFYQNKQLLFEVADTGCGISEDMQQNIFKEFRQGYDKSEKDYSGTGLGLAISKALINLMQGDIGVESKLGEGSRFFFYLPFVEVSS